MLLNAWLMHQIPAHVVGERGKKVINLNNSDLHLVSLFVFIRSELNLLKKNMFISPKTQKSADCAAVLESRCLTY